MKSAIALAGLTGLASLATGAPVVDHHNEIRAAIAKRAVTDATVLQFALVLEHLEATFYSQALSKFDASAFTSAGYPSNVRDAIAEIGNDEAAHVSFLTAGLQAAGATPVSACTYKFPYTDVNSFLAVSQILENTGVSAYLGAAGLISNKQYLTAAGSILTVEARHNAFIRYINDLSPFPAPFDTPVVPQGIVTVATPFFASCPNGSAPADLGLVGFPAVNVTGTAKPGSTLTVASTNTTGASFCTFLSGLNATSSSYSSGSCQIPTNGMVGEGQIYVFLTNAQGAANASTIVAGPGVIEIDTGSQSAGSSPSNSSQVGGGSSGSGSGSGSGGSSSSGAGHLAVSGVLASVVAGFAALLL